MTPEQITLVQSSFDRLGPDVPELATRFYAELFTRDPGLQPLFTTDLELRKVRFADKLTEIVHAIPRLPEMPASEVNSPARPGVSSSQTDIEPSAPMNSVPGEPS